MARTVEEIQDYIIAAKEAEPELAEASSESRRAKWLLWTYVFAQAQNLLEQEVDAKKLDIEAQVRATPSANPYWLQAQMFLFQYSATTTQTIQLNTTTFAYEYPVVDEDLRIITRCSVSTGLDKVVYIKVAKGDTPAALSAPELSAAQSYIDTIAPASITYTVQSTAGDKLYLEGSIYYQGQYAASIEEDVEAAINDYMGSIPFDGVLKIVDLQTAIRAVEGVNDVVLVNAAARADGTVFASKTFIIQSNTLLESQWQTQAGYIIEETTAGETFADKLTYVAQ